MSASRAVIAARCLLGALLAISLVRAMTQSVTPGEAWNFDRFVAPPWAEALSRFDINNHVLNTLLVRISTARFHLTELSLRLPSLLAGALYLLAVYRLARRWFGDGLPFLSVIGLLTLNPLVVDALSEARGYGLALAAWTWALYLILESTQSFNRRNLNLAGVCLGLSVVASLAFAACAVALLLVSTVWFVAEGRRQKLPQLMFLTLFVLLILPVNRAQWATLAVGAKSLGRALDGLADLSLGTSHEILHLGGRAAAVAAALAGLVFCVRYWRRREDALLVIAGAILPLSFVLLLLSHDYLHTPFPQQGAVFLVPMSMLLVTSIILKFRMKAAQITYLVLCAMLCACYLAIFPFGMYTAAPEFAGGRTLAKSLRQKAGTANVRLGVSLDAEPVVNYYRWRYRQSNWQAERKPLTETYDYYVLTPADAALIEQRHLHVLYRDRGLTLAQ
ncbi:MAG: glycosyltransferase family 39 protein [Candidatus Solibacter sp.]